MHGKRKKSRDPGRDRDSESYRCASFGMNTVQVRIEPLLSGTEIGVADLATMGGPEALRRIEPPGKFAGCWLFGETPTAAFSNRRIAS